MALFCVALILVILAGGGAAVDPNTPLSQVVLEQPFADRYGAKCLDGSPPSYYILNQQNVSSRWILFIEGGGCE